MEKSKLEGKVDKEGIKAASKRAEKYGLPFAYRLKCFINHNDIQRCNKCINLDDCRSYIEPHLKERTYLDLYKEILSKDENT